MNEALPSAEPDLCRPGLPEAAAGHIIAIDRDRSGFGRRETGVIEPWLATRNEFGSNRFVVFVVN